MERLEFVRLVADMRNAQRRYFRTRSTADLDHSKRLEKRVDEAIKRELDGQQSLFDEEG